MSYDFSRFSTQSFERFVQALAADMVGARVQIYGAGRDGAREATYEGRCQIAAEEWNGYVVFQAKYHHAAEDLAHNAAWMIAQIDAEMKKFADLRRALRRPDYYVIATNVRLSAGAANAGGQGEGGVDKVTSHLALKAAALGIKTVVLWDQDTLSALLDTREEVRTAFGFWIQPSDVLAALFRKLEGPDRTEVLWIHLREGLRQAREIKTKDVGQTIGRAVALDEVFIDLPIVKTPPRSFGTFVEIAELAKEFEETEEPDTVDWDQMERPDFSGARIVTEVMRRCADRFSPKENVDRDSSPPCRRGPTPNRVVLLGGPGQGKSTVGQFLAQLCRARLLSEMPRHYSPETHAAIAAVLTRANKEHIPVDGPLRYPFYVELPRYADALSVAFGKGDRLSITSFISRHIGRDAEIELPSSKLKDWLRLVPSLVILDGLDEVPSSGNRSDIILAIEELLDVLHEANADCLVFATSRPQGYRDELSPDHWTHWHLDSLQPEDALRLADNVAPVLVSDDIRRKEIISKLKEAAEEPTTAPLLTSPLQVMLLFQLVATHNNVPKDRWTLFSRHYDTLRDREISKGGAAGHTIGLFRQQIDGIHADAGYLLHLRAEGAGGANSYLTVDELRSIVKARLVKDGFETSEVQALTEQIVHVATDRLVFLRAQFEGQVAFDVRSLQEFMAAVRLTTSPETLIVPRLREITGKSHWLHVLRIAAGKILGSAQHEAIREGLVAMFDSVDAGDRSDDDRILRTGSRVALQLLADGAANSIPGFRRNIAARALNLLDSDPEVTGPLADSLEAGHRSLIEGRLTEALNSGNQIIETKALRLGLLLAAPDSGKAWPWALELLVSHWPTEAGKMFDLIDSRELIPNDPRILAQIKHSQFVSSPRAVVNWLGSLESDQDDGPVPFSVAVTSSPGRSHAIPLLRRGDKKPTGIAFSYLSVGSAGRVIEVTDGATPIWHVARAAGSFSEDPSPRSAAMFLGEVISRGLMRETLTLSLPWLLRALVENADNHEVLAARQSALLEGRYGEINDWTDREMEWEKGCSIETIVSRWRAVAGSPERVLGAPIFLGPKMTASGSRVDAQEDLLALAESLAGQTWASIPLFFYIARRRAKIVPSVEEYLSRFEIEDAAETLQRVSWLTDALITAACQAKDPTIFLQKIKTLLSRHPSIARLTDVNFGRACKLLEGRPAMRELIPVIATGAWAFWSPVAKQSVSIPAVALERVSTDTRAIASSVELLRIRYGTDSAQEIDINTLLSWDELPLILVLGYLTREHFPRNREIGLAIARAILLRPRSSWTTRAYSVIQRSVEGAPVGFSEHAKAKALQLPPALPSKPTHHSAP